MVWPDVQRAGRPHTDVQTAQASHGHGKGATGYARGLGGCSASNGHAHITGSSSGPVASSRSNSGSSGNSQQRQQQAGARQQTKVTRMGVRMRWARPERRTRRGRGHAGHGEYTELGMEAS